VEPALVVDGALGGGAVTVEGGTLKGNGRINGAVTVNASGTLCPRTSIGALTISDNLTPRGNTLIEVDRDAGTNDFVGGIGLLDAGGTVTVNGPTQSAWVALSDSRRRANERAPFKRGGGRRRLWPVRRRS
jgi:hypothetical protein